MDRKPATPAPPRPSPGALASGAPLASATSGASAASAARRTGPHPAPGPHSSVGPAGLVRLLGAWRAGRPAYRALAAALRTLVLDGRVPLAVRLPAERELAAALDVSRTTVAAAFDLLRTEGYLASRRGSGSWTALPDGHRPPSRGVTALDPVENTTGVIDLGVVAMPAPEPWTGRAAADALAALPAHSRGHGNLTYGLQLLREAVADRYTARGAPTTPDQIMITGGAAGGLALLLRELAAPGDRVVVESPSYANALLALRRAGTRPVPIGLGSGATAWDPDAWGRALRQAAPRLGYLIPDFHNPAGVLMPEPVRAEFTERARNAGTVLVVDETMAELALDAPGAMPRPMAAFDPGGCTVVTIGSASKTFWGGLRIGWVRAAPPLIRRLGEERGSLDVSSPVLEQLIVHRLLTEHLEPLLDARRAAVREQRDVLAGELAARLPGWEFTVPGGGLSLWVRIDGTASGSALAGAAERLGVRIAPGARFGVDGTLERFVRVPFVQTPDVAREAVTRLAAARSAVVEGVDGERVRIA